MQGLTHDADLLQEFVGEWEKFRDVDPKLDEFIRRLKTELLDPKRNETGKLVIFSEARDTTSHLTDELNKAGFGPLLTVDSHNRKTVMPIVRGLEGRSFSLTNGNARGSISGSGMARMRRFLVCS